VIVARISGASLVSIARFSFRIRHRFLIHEPSTCVPVGIPGSSKSWALSAVATYLDRLGGLIRPSGLAAHARQLRPRAGRK
jgi:hypothetical protein